MRATAATALVGSSGGATALPPPTIPVGSPTADRYGMAPAEPTGRQPVSDPAAPLTARVESEDLELTTDPERTATLVTSVYPVVDRSSLLTISDQQPGLTAEPAPPYSLRLPLTGKRVSGTGTLTAAGSEAVNVAGEQIATDEVILPTPGVSVEPWLDGSSCCEHDIGKLREAAAPEAEAQARIVELEADRRVKMLDPDDTSDPDQDGAPRLHRSSPPRRPRPELAP